MLSNYFKNAWRNLSKNGFYTALNMLGLSIGIGAGLLVLLWVQREYNQYNYPDASRIYRVNAHLKSGEGVNSWPYTSAAIVPHAMMEVPEMEMGSRVWERLGQNEFRFDDKLIFEKNAAYVDTTFFQLFGIEMVNGDVKHPFTAVNSIVMTETTAKKFFGSENPVGKIVQRGPDPKDLFVISGVMRDWPTYAGFDYTYLMNFERVTANYHPDQGDPAKYDDLWGAYSMYSFVKLRAGSPMSSAEQKIHEMNVRNNPRPINDARLSLQPIRQLTMYGADGSDSGAKTVQLFLFAALFILGIACINYINLNTAQASKRAREVGMRKIIGATKGQLLSQFMFESALVTGSSFLLGLGALRIVLPYCNNLFGQKMNFDLSDPAILQLLAATFVGVLLLSGIYPALVLSRFQPMQVLKGKIRAGSSSTQLLRRALVVLQFGLSIILLVGTTLIGRQLDFIRNRDSGLNRNQVFSFVLRPNMMPHKDAIVSALELTPGVEKVSLVDSPILGSSNTTSGSWEGKTGDDNINFYYFNVDKNFKDLLKINLVEGEWFSGTAADTNKVVLNETAIKTMGMTNPIGKHFSLGGDGVIAGVVRDFNFNSAREKIRPVAFYSVPETSPLIYVRAQQTAMASVLAAAGENWKKFEATMPFDYEFLNDQFEKMYRAEQRTSMLFGFFSTIAMLIACIGLLGLASFMATQRNKEISIRKTLGATVANITALLTQDFLKLVLIAIVLATPVAWYFMDKWLSDFAYRVDIQWWMFALAGLGALVIAFLTVGYQSVRAALANPVDALKNN